MALSELRDRLSRSFEQMRVTTMMDQTTLNGCLNEITCALLDVDLPRSLVKEIKSRSKMVINSPPASNKGLLIYKNFLAHLISELDPGKSALIQYRIRKDPTNIVMFIGLQGVEKTKMCAKYARYHLNKGFRPALVCADTFKADAFLQLKTAATDEVPVFQSDGKDDPAKIASEGIAKFKKERCNLIIVDTSDRHTEYSPLFEEVRCLAETVNPHLVVLVMDSSIGQAAFDQAQAQAFKQSFDFGVVIVTNSVAAAKCPMILAETGVKGELEAFEAGPFVRSLVKCPWVSPDYQPGYTLRLMYNYYRKELGLEKENVLSPDKVRQYVTIMDSMTDEELDKSSVKNRKRVMEIAEASKVGVKEVEEVLITYMNKAKAITEVEERLFKKPDKLRFPEV